MNPKRNKTKRNKTKRNKTRRRNKKQNGGIFTHSNQSCSNVNHEIKELSKYVKEPYHWNIKPYDSTKCHLFIWNKNNPEQNPHIHVHGYKDDTYEYTINKKTYSAKLFGKSPDFYRSVLSQMYSELTQKPHPDKLFMTPDRPTSTIDINDKKPIKSEKKPDGLILGTLFPVKQKLGPIMGQESINVSLDENKGSLL